MKTGISEIIFLLDMSGSMHGMRKSAIDGFNNYLREQKTVEGDARLSLALFNDKYVLPYRSVYIQSVEEIDETVYRPYAMTALYDTIGEVVSQIMCDIGSREKAYRPDTVIVMILTDGMENNSSKWSASQIKNLIKERESDGWKFVYLGANIDSFAEAGSIGISAHNTANINPEYITNNTAFMAMSKMTTAMRTHSPIGGMSAVVQEVTGQ